MAGQQEHLPVAASLMGATGLDYELITFARQFLEKSNLPDAVETGRYIFGSDPTKIEQKLDSPTYSFSRQSSSRAAGRGA